MKSKPSWVPSVQSPGNQYEGMPDDDGPPRLANGPVSSDVSLCNIPGSMQYFATGVVQKG